MWRFRLIRFRLTLTYTLLLTCIFVLFSVGLFITLDRVLYDRFYNRIGAAADSVVKDSKVSFRWSPDYSVQYKVESETIGGDLNSSPYKVAFANLNGQLLPGDKKGDPKLPQNPAVKQGIETAV